MSSLLKENPNKPIAGLKFTARELCLCAIMSTIVFLLTFIPKIPIPLGYAHIGDAAIFLIALLAPKRPALLAACIGSALADFIGGFYLWIMPTLFIKFIMAYIVYVIAKPDEAQFSYIKTAIAFVIASLWMTAGYVAFGAVIYDSRRQFVDEFSPIFQSIYQELSGGGETVDLSYQSHVAEHSLRDLLQENRPKDRIMGFTMKGLHRDDLGMLLGGFPIKREGSQGQNKTFVIAMKLAQFDFLKRKGSHRTPILLLDDIFDKLDGQRVEQIVRMVSGNHFGQIFITDTNREFLLSVLERTGKEFKLFNVENGQIREN